ncbi:MAG: Occludin/ELL family protein [Cyanobacteriota bacterium]|nr:Occludin/ELL family protein [Cyanobacteriota bacterium]
MNRTLLAALLPAAVLIAPLAPERAAAGPVVCTTTLEAPSAYAEPVAVSRCGPVQTVPQLVNQRFFTYTAPFSQGVNLTHQITDLLGIALGGVEGNRLMGFGFPDQTIVFDALALQNTTAVLLDAQSNPMPLRTPDIGFCFGTSLAGSACSSGRR